MKKLLLLAAILALVFTACEQPTDETHSGGKLPSLTIRNESSYILTDVKFSGISFASSGNDLPVSSQSVKQLTANDLNKAGFITFTRKDIGIACRTEAISIGSEDYTFTFTNNTPVEEQANSGNKNSLSQISFLSKVTVERGGLTVAKNDTENLGEAVINIGKSTEFTVKNSSGGKLLFTGTEPVKITGTGAGSFPVVQPSSSEIAPNSSLTFKINFTPATVQNYSATVTIYSNDQDGNFTFNITATGVPPKPIASVFYEENEILQNGAINAGEVVVNQSKNITVVIKNTGVGVLTIDTANISITGSDAGAFTKTTNPGGSISVGGQTSFIIDCKPTKQGEIYAVLTIPTNDSSRNNIVVYLRIRAVIPVTVSYNINGGSGTTPGAQTANAGSIITLPNRNGFSRNGYTFGGWNTNSSGTGTNYSAGSSYTVSGNITLYAMWYCTVTYNINGGSGTTPGAQTANAGSSITLHTGSGLSRSGYTFGGWNTNTSGTGTNYSAGSSYNVTGNTTLYAKWELITNVNVPGANLAAKLSWLQTNALSNVNYTVEVTANESIGPTTLYYSGKTNIGITLKGTGAVRTVSLSSIGAMFTVRSGVTLVLDNNITLRGRSDNTDELVKIGYGFDDGTLVMNAGSCITGNNGGGVYLSSGGTFTMNDGTISVNASDYGGGVYVSSGTFTMSGGTISGNTASIIGGVYVSSGTFTMSGGTISGNTASSFGGGVRIYSIGIFIKTGGIIYGYNASDTVNSNVVKNSSGAVQSNLGHAVYATGSNSVVKRKETTAGTGVNMMFNGDNGTFSGAWDN